MKKLRPIGQVTEDLEKVLIEMTSEHELQRGEVLSLVNSWITIHADHCIEVYTDDNSSPEFYYGPRSKK